MGQAGDGEFLGNRNRPRRKRANAQRVGQGLRGARKAAKRLGMWGWRKRMGVRGQIFRSKGHDWAREGRGARNERGTAETRNRVRDEHRGDFERATWGRKTGEGFWVEDSRVGTLEDKNSGTREDKEGGRTRDKVGGAHQDRERTREGNGGPTEMKRNRGVGVGE